MINKEGQLVTSSLLNDKGCAENVMYHLTFHLIGVKERRSRWLASALASHYGAVNLQTLATLGTIRH